MMKIPFTHILEKVSRYYGITPERILECGRNDPNGLEARQVCHYFGYTLNEPYGKEVSFAMVGKYFGNKNHATALHSMNVIRGFVEVNPVFRNKIHALRQKIMHTCRHSQLYHLPPIFRSIMSVEIRRSQIPRRCFDCWDKIEKGSEYVSHRFRYQWKRQTSKLITLDFHQCCYPNEYLKKKKNGN